MISESNPLQRFFREIVERNYGGLGIRDLEVQSYVAGLLAEFCESGNISRIRGEDGRPLLDLGEMLRQADPVYGPAPSFDRERQVRKHIGDYSLFFTGMFPESISRHHWRRAHSVDLLDFIHAGKESYFIVSKFEHFEYAKVAPLFRQMSQEFERLVYGLNQVKNEMRELQHPIALRTDEFLM
ncbi:MAG TPA: hypothetical protein VNW97_12250 [Candidatus Saccharimonadales bacterium]|jgi:hypothetical protein|nr:hypothetical protein [Candidatus Saccharimonadales bacterium]